MTTIPEWVRPGANVAVLASGHLSTSAKLHTIVRVGKRYAILDDDSRFDTTRTSFNGALARSSGSTWKPTEYLHPADSPVVVAVLTKQRIGTLGVKLTRVIEAFINEPTVDQAGRARDLIHEISEACAATQEITR